MTNLDKLTKQELKATLVAKTKDQRFYKLNHKMHKGIIPLSSLEVDINKELADLKEKIKPEFSHLIPENGCDIVCISDAHTHIERLVFCGTKMDDDEYGRLPIQIDGVHTMSIHGGNPKYVKPDAVYLRRIAKLNGFQFKNISENADS